MAWNKIGTHKKGWILYIFHGESFSKNINLERTFDQSAAYSGSPVNIN